MTRDQFGRTGQKSNLFPITRVKVTDNSSSEGNEAVAQGCIQQWLPGCLTKL
jgi:hypothetical protein